MSKINGGIVRLTLDNKNFVYPFTIFVNNVQFGGSYNNSYSTVDITGLTVGDYTIKILDGNGNSVSKVITVIKNTGIDTPQEPTISLSDNGVSISIRGITNGNSNLNMYSYYGVDQVNPNINLFEGSFTGNSIDLSGLTGLAGKRIYYYITEYGCPNNSKQNTFVISYEKPTLSTDSVDFTELYNINNDITGYTPTVNGTVITQPTSKVLNLGFSVNNLPYYGANLSSPISDGQIFQYPDYGDNLIVPIDFNSTIDYKAIAKNKQGLIGYGNAISKKTISRVGQPLDEGFVITDKNTGNLGWMCIDTERTATLTEMNNDWSNNNGKTSAFNTYEGTFPTPGPGHGTVLHHNDWEYPTYSYMALIDSAINLNQGSYIFKNIGSETYNLYIKNANGTVSYSPISSGNINTPFPLFAIRKY